MNFKTITKHQRRQKEFDGMILLSLILGFSTRKQAKFFKNFIGECISHVTLTTILNKIIHMINIYHNRALTDEYEYLYLDAMWANIKELNVKNRPILFALGVKGNGKKYILSFLFKKLLKKCKSFRKNKPRIKKNNRKSRIFSKPKESQCIYIP